MPATPGEFCTTGLFSGSAKLALVAEVLRRRGPADGSESVADFTVRRLGREFLDYAIDPFVAGVYAGDPARLSVREAFPKLHALEQQHGSLIRGALRKRNASAGPRVRMVSFPEGLAELPKALAVKLGPAVRLRTRVRAVARRGRDWVLTTERDGLARTETFAGVVCALPADALAEVRWDDFPEAQAFAALAGIDHPPVVSVFLGFRRADVAHPLDGFGFLVPKVERRSILGTLFSSTLFAGRSPDGCVALTTFVGGARQPDLAALDDGQLVRLVRAELGDLLGVRAGPIFVSLRRHPRAIPQYGIGHARHQAACAAAEAAAPGLSIGGNVRDGISLSSCLVSGCRLARAAIAG
jgi:oxygen-dependent protoporphyrinogen oxidase